MASISDRLLANSNGLIASTRLTPVADASYGGQNGPMLNLRRWVNNTTHISKSAIIEVVEFPRFVQYLSDPASMRRAIKSFFEVHAKIEGLQKGLTVDTNSTEIGAAGHKQHEVTKVNQQQSDITASLADKYGLYFQNMLTIWIRYGMADPETTFPLITSVSDNVTDMLADMYSCTLLAYEPDPRGMTVQKAWLLTNVFPTSNGPDEGRKDLSSAGSTTELSIPFMSLQDTSYGVLEFAQERLDLITRSSRNPLLRNAFVDSIASDVAAVSTGYQQRLSDAAGEMATTATP